jgi:hypothetical protein
MPTIGQSIAKADLLQRARDFQVSASSNNGIPYQRALKAENDTFISSLQDAPDGSLAEIKSNALAQAQALQKKATITSLAGMGLMAASLLLPIPGGQLVHMAGVAGGIYLSQFVGGKAAAQAARQRGFAGQLGEWQRSIDAQAAAQPAQPTPAPAQPPAQQPAQTQA